MGQRSADWYADPMTVGAARWWDGRAWTDVVSWGGTIVHDPTPLAEVERRAALADATTVSDYLADAEAHGVVTPVIANVLRLDVEQRVAGGATPARTGPAPVEQRERPTPHRPRHTPAPPSTVPSAAPSTARATAPTAPPAPAGDALPPPSAPSEPVTPRPTSPDRRPTPLLAAPPRPSSDAVTPEEPITIEPGRLAQWWADARHAIRTDLALHGLAYLGVLLLFAGVTGLIAFSFGNVAPWVRFVAELLVPSTLFLAGWQLARRGAVAVGAALTLLGGAITPIVVIASLTDGAPIPPDLSGRPLPVVQGIAVALVAVAMVFAVRRRPSNPLRFLVGPTVWMAAGITAGVTRDPVPSGYEMSRPDSLQLGVVLAAITVTLLWSASRRVPAALADATRLVALPVAGVVYLIELILAGDEGWPIASTIVVGIAMLALLESSVKRLSDLATSGLQLAVVTVAALRLSLQSSSVWIAAGAAIALLALVEYLGWRRPQQITVIAGLVLAGQAFLLTLAEPTPALVGFGVLAAWGVWRHVVPAAWLAWHDDFGVVPAASALVVTASVWRLTDGATTLVASAAAVLVIAIAGRLWRPLATDVLWRWFVPGASTAVVIVSAGLTWGEHTVAVTAAAAMSALAIALSAAPVAARAWLVASSIIWSLANLAEALDIGRDVQAVTLAASALALVIGSLVVARPIGVHLATIGQVVGLAAFAAPTWPGWAATAVVGAATAGWFATTFIDERGEAVHIAAARAAFRATSNEQDGAATTPVLDEVAPILALTGLWATAWLALDAAGVIALDDPWGTVVAGGIALLAACVVRVTPWRRARRSVLASPTLILAAIAAAEAISSVGTDRDHWAPVISLALAVLVVVVTRSPRPIAFVWSGWIGGAAFTVYLVDRLGLDRDWADVTLAGWGAAALVGGLAAHRRRRGPIVADEFAGDRLLFPPVVLGAVAFTVGGALGLSDGSDLAIGWTAAGMSIVVLAVALLVPLGALVAVAQTLATAAFVLLAPWEPMDRPWTFVLWALVLLAAALATRRTGAWSLARWDVPSFLVAHGVAALALVAAIDADAIVATYAGFGALSIAVAAVLRRWPWAASGGVLLLVAAADAGHGWLALILAIEGVALTVAGLQRSREIRWGLLGLGAVAIVGAWFELAAWLSWSASTVFYTTVPSAAALTLLAAGGLRTVRIPRELAGVWSITGTVVAVGSALAGAEDVARRPGGLTIAGSMLLLAVAAAVSASVVGPVMRWVAAGLAAAAWAPLAWAWDVSDATATIVGTSIALAGFTIAPVLRRRRPDAVWLLPAILYLAITQAGAALAALGALPDHALLILVLLAVSAELVASGQFSGRSEFHLVSPIPSIAAWAFAADDAVDGVIGWWWFNALMPIAAAIAVLAAIGLRTGAVPRRLSTGWAAAGVFVTFGTAVVGLADVARLPGGLVFAGSLVLLAVGAAVTATVVGQAARWIAAGLAAAAWAPLAWALELSDTVITVVGTAMALGGLTAALAMHATRPRSVWLRPGAFHAAVVQAGAAVVAVATLPDHDLLIVVLLALSAELVAAGVLVARPTLYVWSPAPACAAWLLYAGDALTGNANWFTMPIGLTLLVMVGLLRWIRRERGGDRIAIEIVALELIGMSFLVAPALARTLAGHLWNGVLAIAVGSAIAAWGVVTRVRWRAGFGAVSIVLATVLLIGVPLSRSVTWRGLSLWITLCVIGVTAIVVATTLERRHAQVKAIAHRIDEMIAGWERIPRGSERPISPRESDGPLPPPDAPQPSDRLTDDTDSPMTPTHR